MDWKRVESILIVALLITNAIVVIALYNSRYLSSNEILKFDDRQKIVKELLKEKNIIIDEELGSDSVVLPNIYLTYETYEDGGFIELLLGDEYQSQGNKFVSSDAEIVIKNEQNLVYRRTVIPAMSVLDMGLMTDDSVNESNFNKAYSVDILLNKNLKDDEIFAIGVAEDFLKEKGIKSEDTQFSKVTQIDRDSYNVKYRQYENNKFLEDAYMDVIVTGDKVVELDRKWFGSIVQVGGYSEIESPLLALFRLINVMDKDGSISENRRAIHGENVNDSLNINKGKENYKNKRVIRITSMELVYRLVSDIVPIRFLEGDSTVYWRIEMDTGKVVYMKAKEVRID